MLLYYSLSLLDPPINAALINERAAAVVRPRPPFHLSGGGEAERSPKPMPAQRHFLSAAAAAADNSDGNGFCMRRVPQFN